MMSVHAIFCKVKRLLVAYFQSDDRDVTVYIEYMASVLFDIEAVRCQSSCISRSVAQKQILLIQ